MIIKCVRRIKSIIDNIIRTLHFTRHEFSRLVSSNRIITLYLVVPYKYNTAMSITDDYFWNIR